MFPVVRAALVIGAIAYLSPERGSLSGVVHGPRVASVTDPGRLETMGRTLETAARLSGSAPRIVGEALVAPRRAETAPAPEARPVLRDTLHALDRMVPWSAGSPPAR